MNDSPFGVPLLCEFLCAMDPSELAVLPSRLVSERFAWDAEIAETGGESWVVLVLIVVQATANLPLTCSYAMLKSALRDGGYIRPLSIF